MIKKVLLAITCISALFLVIGCGNNNQGNSANEDTISIEIKNETEDIYIGYVLFYGDHLDEWGEDMLEEDDEVIEPGEKVTFLMPEGEYAIYPMTFDYYVLPSVRGVSDDYTHQIGEEGKLPILVTNQREEDIGFFYLSPSDSDDWGEDWLSGEIIGSGISRFFFADPDTYDALAIDTEGEAVLETRGIEVDGERHFIIE